MSDESTDKVLILFSAEGYIANKGDIANKELLQMRGPWYI